MSAWMLLETLVSKRKVTESQLYRIMGTRGLGGICRGLRKAASDWGVNPMGLYRRATVRSHKVYFVGDAALQLYALLQGDRKE